MAKRTPLSVNVLSPSELAAKNLGPLVLANSILERMDIRRIVNLHCPGDQRLEIPVGDVIYALVANRLCSPEPLYQVGDWAEYSTDNVFTSFKEQHLVETAHGKWKNPIRLRPLFLKRVTRIESLIFVQFLALMVFYLLQRRYRQAKGPSCRTTAETLLKRFALCDIGVRYTKRSVNVTPFTLKQPQESVLKTLGFPYPHEQIRSQVACPSG
mgnify:CR=1 FL=1